MQFIEIITIIIISIYLLAMFLYFAKRIRNGEGINYECDSCKNKGTAIIKFYYKQKKKEHKKSNL